MTHAHAGTGFAASTRQGKKAIDFVPTDSQVQTAKIRIVCTLNKHDGSTPVRSLNDAIDLFCKEVFNRNNELGTYARNEFKTTIRTAVHGLIADGHIKLDGQIIILTSKGRKAYKPQLKNRRLHNQKYPNGRRSFAVA